MDQGQKPVNPYAPAGAPYAPGSNTPVPPFASPVNPAPANASPANAGPAVPNTAAPNQDIVLPSSDPEKPKFFTKKFIILASAGLLLIVAAIVTGLILQNNRKNVQNTSSTNNTSSSSVPSCQKSFNRYANYMLSGTTSDGNITTTPTLSGSYLSYAFMNKANDTSIETQTITVVDANTGESSEVSMSETVADYPDVNRSEFLTKSKEYFDDFYKCYADDSNSSDIETVDNYRDALNELLSASEQITAEKGFELRTRIIEELDMLNRIVGGDKS